MPYLRSASLLETTSDGRTPEGLGEAHNSVSSFALMAMIGGGRR